MVEPVLLIGVSVNTRRFRSRLYLYGTISLGVLAVAVALWLTLSWRAVDPLRGFHEAPVYTRAAWHDDELASAMRRLDQLSRKRRWKEKDATFIRELAQREIEPMSPRTRAVAPLGIRMLSGAPEALTPEEAAMADPPLPPMPPPGDESSYAAWVMLTPEGREAARWLDMYMTVSQAESLIWERRSRGIPIPPTLEEFGLHKWSEMLTDPDERNRLAGAGRLIAGRFIESPEVRTRVEALRVGDPSDRVRAQIDRRLRIYDRDYHGIDPGPLVECNTCP